MEDHKPLHVCFDARKLNHGGIGVYTQNAILGLLRSGVKITLVVNDISDRLSELGENISIQEVSSQPSTIEELFFFAKQVDWTGIDIFHTANYILPFRIPCAKVITVHDLIHLRYPEQNFYPFAAVPLMFSGILRANRVIAVSRATYGELKNFTRYMPQVMRKVKVITNGLCPSFLKREPVHDFPRIRFGMCSPYILSVLSTVKPHKGVKDLLDAFIDLERRGVLKQHGDIRLVLVGQGTENLLQVERLLHRADALRCVKLLGAVSEEELFQLYTSAEALIVPSFIEGFCLPVIESQAVRTPVITRPIPAVLDMLSPRDLVCRDFSLDGLITAVERFLDQPREEAPSVDSLSKWQDDFYKNFDPFHLGNELHKVYRKMLGRKPPTEIDEQKDTSLVLPQERRSA